ncbi:hypothetical protein BABINDRAFT_23590, partial [Babjeviella inositovora NRRL Y-12698]
LFAIAAVLAAKLVPQLNGLLQYGKVSLAKKEYQKHERDRWPPALVDQFIRFLVTITVPKSWFIHFYVLSSILSISNQTKSGDSKPYTVCVILCCMIMTQSCRRLYECRYVSKPNPQARMNISHYLVGIFFYTAISVNCLFQAITHDIAGSFSCSCVSLGMVLLVLAFVYFQYEQYVSHVYLALLVKYRTPQAGWFRYVYCAHYLQEICIYSCMAATGGVLPLTTRIPSNSNWLVVAWVVSNLSISAIETGKFYDEK